MRLSVLVAATLVLLGMSSPVFAVTDLHDATRSFDGLLGTIKQHASSWNGILRGYALNLFWTLTSIQCVLTFYPYLFKQTDFGELFGEIFRFVFMTGIFYALLLHSSEWGEMIVNSFRQAAGAASGVGARFRPGEIFGLGVEIAKMVGNVETWNPAEALMIAAATVIILISFVFIAAFMQITLIESYIVINVSVFFIAFAGLLWSREYAYSMIKYAIAVGAKLLILTLLIGLMVGVVRDWQAAYKYDETNMWTLCGLAFVCAILVKSITDMLQSLLTGVSTGGGSIIGQMSAAAMAGGVAGAAVAHQLATSGPVSSAMGGVADLIKSSFGGGGSSSGPSKFTGGPSGGGGGMGGGSGGPSSRVGGGGSRTGSSSMGAASSPPPSSPSSSGSGSSSSSASSTAPSAASSVAGMAHATANVALKGLGTGMSIAMPGADAAADLSIGSPPTPPSNLDLSESKETPENIIRPVSAAEQAEESIDTMSSLEEALNKRGNKA